MNDKRKTKKQLLEDLQLERERSLALQEVSKRVAAAHDTDEVLDLIVNKPRDSLVLMPVSSGCWRVTI
jgi:hypothetical protein